ARVLLEHHRRERHEFRTCQPLVDAVVDFASRWRGKNRARPERTRAILHAPMVDRDDTPRRQGIDGLFERAFPRSHDPGPPMRSVGKAIIVVTAEIKGGKRITPRIPFFGTVARVQMEQTAPDGKALVAHYRIYEDSFRRSSFQKDAIEPDIGENTARDDKRCH